MKSERLQDALGTVRDDYVLDAHGERKTVKKPWLRWGVLAACLCLIAACAFGIPKLLHSGAQDPVPVKPYAPDIGQYAPVDPGTNPAPEPGPGDIPIPIPGPEPSNPGTNPVEPTPVEPTPIVPTPVETGPVFYNQVDAVPAPAAYFSLASRPLTDDELTAVVPEGLPARLVVTSAVAFFVGYTDEAGVIQGDGGLDNVLLTLKDPEEGSAVQIALWPAGRGSVYDTGEPYDPALYTSTQFAAGDALIFQCGETVWTDLTCGGVRYLVTAGADGSGREFSEAASQRDFYQVVNALLLSVKTPDLDLVPNP